jgi:uncharacterized protein YaaQ
MREEKEAAQVEIARHVFLITGGSRRIGLATAHRLLQDGASVIITGLDRERLDTARTALDSHPHVRTVVADAASVEGLHARRPSQLGGIRAARCNTADLGLIWRLVSAGGVRFGGCDDGDRSIWPLAGPAVHCAFEFPVGHFALDDARVAAGAACEQVAADFSQCPGQCAGQP